MKHIIIITPAIKLSQNKTNQILSRKSDNISDNTSDREKEFIAETKL